MVPIDEGKHGGLGLFVMIGVNLDGQPSSIQFNICLHKIHSLNT